MYLESIKHKKKGHTVAKIHFDAFRCCFVLYIADKYEQVKKLDFDYSEDGGFGSFDGATVKEFDEKATAYMVLKPHVNISSLVHECKHMLNAVFTQIGYEPKTNNDEIECYLLGQLCSIVNDCVNTHKKNFKIK